MHKFSPRPFLDLDEEDEARAPFGATALGPSPKIHARARGAKGQAACRAIEEVCEEGLAGGGKEKSGQAGLFQTDAAAALVHFQN